MSVKSYFHTLIYSEKLGSPQSLKRFNKELLKEAYQIASFDKNGKKWSGDNYPGGFTSYASMSQLHKQSSTFAKLSAKIKTHAVKYIKSLDYEIKASELEMTSCWVNIVPPGHFHSLHLHPLSTISGTYYLKTPKNCGDLRFEDPRLSKLMAAPNRKANAKTTNKQFIKIKAEENNLVLFESWLRHEVEKNLSQEDRVSISFNFNWF